MIGLVLVELRRIVVRRFLWGLLALTAVVMGIASAFVFSDHRDEVDTDVVVAIEEAQQAQEQQEALCREQVPAAEAADLCALPDVTADDISLEDRRFHPTDIWREQGESQVWLGPTSSLTVGDDSTLATRDDGETGALPALLVGWALLAVVLGAGLIGAEYKAGTIETALLWEPRRLRVLGAKYAAGALAAIGATVALSALLFVMLAPTLLLRGTTEGMDGDFWGGVTAAVGRGSLIAALAALAGMALATVTRGTAGGIATVYVGLGGAEILFRILGGGTSRFLPGFNAIAVVLDQDVEAFEIDDLFEQGQIHGTGTAVVVVLVSVALVTALAVALFLRRDVDE